MDKQLSQTTHEVACTPQNALTVALQSPRAIDAEPAQLKYVLAQAMAKAFADMGQKATDPNDINYLVENMPAEVTRNLPNIRLNEIPIAINHGILHQYGDFYGLNVATFMRFLIKHYQSEQRAAAVKTTMAAPQPAPGPSPAQLKQIRLNRVATAFEHYKAKGYYNDYGSLVFDNINALGKIPISEEREAQILELARLNLVRQYSRASIFADERAKLKANLNKLLQGNAATLIITEAKRIALIAYFEGLMRDESKG